MNDAANAKSLAATIISEHLAAQNGDESTGVSMMRQREALMDMIIEDGGIEAWTKTSDAAAKIVAEAIYG